MKHFFYQKWKQHNSLMSKTKFDLAIKLNVRQATHSLITLLFLISGSKTMHNKNCITKIAKIVQNVHKKNNKNASWNKLNKISIKQHQEMLSDFPWCNETKNYNFFELLKLWYSEAMAWIYLLHIHSREHVIWNM